MNAHWTGYIKKQLIFGILIAYLCRCACKQWQWQTLIKNTSGRELTFHQLFQGCNPTVSSQRCHTNDVFFPFCNELISICKLLLRE